MDAEKVDELFDYLDIPPWGRRKGGGNVLHYCPLHDDAKQSAGLSWEKEVWNCFVCGGRTVPQLIAEVHNMKIGRAIEVFRRHFGGGVLAWQEIKDRADGKPKPEPEPKYLSEVQLESLPYADLTSRGVPRSVTRRFGVRWYEKKSMLLFPAWTYPDREYAGHAARLIGHERIRYGNLEGFKKAELLYGLWQSGHGQRWAQGDRGEPVVVAEGPIDVMCLNAAGIPAVGLFGAKASPQQARLLKNARKVILFLDNDWPGLGGNWRAYKLLRRSVRLWVARYDPEQWDCDPADLTVDDRRAAVEAAQPGTPARFQELARLASIYS